MLLVFLRHGDAESDPSIPDEDRALTQVGVASIQRVAEIFRRLELRFDVAYSSPLLRARQSAELAIASLQHKPTVEFTDHLRVGAHFQNLFDLLNTHPAAASLLVVGHEPYISQLISMLLVGSLDAQVDIRKASLTCMETSPPVRPRSATLKWMLTPEMINLITG